MWDNTEADASTNERQDYRPIGISITFKQKMRKKMKKMKKMKKKTNENDREAKMALRLSTTVIADTLH